MRKAVNHLKKSDPVMAALIARLGPPRLQSRPATFWALARSIVFQQLNGKAAATIFNRLEQACGGELTPQSLLALSEEQLRAVGLSKQKASYIRDLAQKSHAGELDFAALPAMSDVEVIERLTRIKGIGTWTAQMFLMFALERPNVLPTADYGIRAAILKHYLTKPSKNGAKSGRKLKLPSPKQIEKIAAAWHPYCTLACWYLWRSMDTKN
jgi:DNA-3-methyladenine glycosylase II